MPYTVHPAPSLVPGAGAPCRDHRSPRWGRPLAALVLLTGAGLVGAGALASWDATSSIDSGALDTNAAAAIKLDSVNGTSFTTGVTGLVPGDYFNRYVDVGATSDGAPASVVTVSAGTAIGAALKVQVDSCSVAWTGTTCPGVITPRLAATSLSPAGGVAHPAVNAAGPDRLRYLFTLDANAPQTLQNQTGTIKIAVSGLVRAGKDRTTS